MVTIQINLEKPNRFKNALHKFRRKAENVMFSAIHFLPEKLTPQPLIDWMGHYVEKRIFEARHQLTRSRWEEVALNELSAKIQQQDAKG